MLIYNSQKEFIGIDEVDLKRLGFENLAELRAYTVDFADLFIKTPGHVHNFKHVHWIDFVSCSEHLAQSSVIIHVKKKTYRGNLEIKNIYMTDAPSEAAYCIYLHNLRELSEQEKEQIAADISSKDAQEEVDFEEPQHFDEPAKQPAIETQTKIEQEEVATIPDAPIELDVFEDEKPQEQQEVQELVVEQEVKQEVAQKEEKPQASSKPTQIYTYDPAIASKELGLPLDLIEEFIEDFIAQAQEFKEPLYTSFEEGDMEQLRTLSHKLKGVAANLRIEDALETITTVNKSDDTKAIKSNLDKFYDIINSLQQQGNISVADTSDEQEDDKKDDDELLITLKDDGETQKQDEVVEDEIKIDLQELDEALPAQEDETQEDEALNIEIQNDEIQNDEKQIADDEDKIEINFDDENDDEITLELDSDDETEKDNETKKDEKTTAMPQIHYDKELAASEIGIDDESFEELFEDFKIESKYVVDEILDAVKQNDMVSIKKKVSKLKGMSENMRFDAIHDEIQTIKTTQDMQEIQKNLDSISQKISQL